MWITVGILVVVFLVVFFLEYRQRKPDQLILSESRGKIIIRTSRFYPQHFSVALPKTTYSTQMNIEASAKGNLDIKVKVAITVAAALDHIPELIRVGGWSNIAVTKAEKELETIIEPRLITAYKRIRGNARNGLAVVTVERDACGGCFNKIPPQKQMDIRMHKKIIVCEYCGRILVDNNVVAKV